MSLEAITFDSTVIEVEVNVADGRYILREASGEAACKYRNAMLACTKLGADGKPSAMRNLADIEPLLVSLCLFEVKGANDEESAVSQKQIKRWPNRIQKKLFDTCIKISDLRDESEDKVLLEKAFTRDDSPCDYGDFCAWLLDLPEKEYESLHALADEDAAKNLSSETEDGTD